MRFFLSAHNLIDAPPDHSPVLAQIDAPDPDDDVSCDEVLLDAFATPAARQ